MRAIHETFELDPETGEATGTVHYWCALHAPADAVLPHPLDWAEPDTRCEDEGHVWVDA
jgi:hypothetical protein